MRILITSQPKTGNVWLRNLLGNVYGLSDLTEKLGDDIPETVPQFVEYVRANGLDDNIVFHQHFFPKEELFEICEQYSCDLATIVRDPYETFVSFYFYVNKNPKHFKGRPPAIMLNKPIDHPDVLNFLATNFRMHLNMSAQWVDSGRSHVVQYERLLRDPVGELKSLTDKIAPVEKSVVEAAVKACEVSAFKKKGGWKSKHIRSASEKTWDQYLTEEHLAVFRDNYPMLIKKIGYEVV